MLNMFLHRKIFRVFKAKDFHRKIFSSLTGAAELVGGEAVDSLVLQVGWLHTPRAAVGQSSSVKIFFIRIEKYF